MPCWIALQTCNTTESCGLSESAVQDTAVAQYALACIALGLTPRVALVDEAVLMDVTGSLRLFGGPARLMERLIKRLALQAPARLQHASGLTSLIALARLRLQGQRGGSGTRLRVADLPLHTLSAARGPLEVLARMGCRTWDDLLRLPRDGVARRFGAPLLAALDRAGGRAPDGYAWLVLPEKFEEKRELDALVMHAPALMAGAAPLLQRLAAWLLGRQCGLCALTLTWHLDPRRGVPPTGEMEIRTAQPAQDLTHVARLMTERLAQLQLPAPVHSLTLKSLETEKLQDAAAATGSLLMDAQQRGDSATALIERLSARLGASQVQSWQAHADHRPELMQSWAPAATGRRRAAHGEESAPQALYPTWLLPQPLRLSVRYNSPVYQGPLVRVAGPQRLEATGWLRAQQARPPAIRDYFIYRSPQAGLLWLYSERLPVAPSDPDAPSGAWYLHGFFA